MIGRTSRQGGFLRVILEEEVLKGRGSQIKINPLDNEEYGMYEF